RQRVVRSVVGPCGQRARQRGHGVGIEGRIGCDRRRTERRWKRFQRGTQGEQWKRDARQDQVAPLHQDSALGEAAHYTARPIIGKLTLPCRVIWAHQDSNLEPKDYESSALTIEL